MTSRTANVIALAAVIVLALAARLIDIQNVEFFHDEAMVAMMAQEMADGLAFPLQGILSSVGIPNPPTSIYVMAVPYAFTNDPVAVTAFIAVLNAVGVGVLWAIVRRWVGYVPALAAGVWLALTPWAVLYSRKIWAQDYMLPFLLVALAAALWGWRGKRRWGQIAMLPVMLFGMQIHFAGWALVPLFAWIVWRDRKQTRLIPVAISIVLGIAVMLPYAIGLTQTLRDDPTRIADVASRSGGDRDGAVESLAYIARLTTGTAIESWVAPTVDPAPFERPAIETTVVVAITAALLIVGGVAVLTRHRDWAVPLLLWVALPIVVFEVGLADVWPHYYVPQLPAFALLIGLGVDALRRTIAAHLTTRTGSVAAFGGLAASLGFAWVGYQSVMQYAYAHYIPIGEGTSGYTTPSRILNEVVDAIPDDIDDVIVASDGDRVWFDVDAARWPVLLRDKAECVRARPVGARMWLYPAGPSALIVAPTAPIEFRNAVGPALDSPVIAGRIGEGDFQVRAGDAAVQPPLPGQLESPIAVFSNGAALVAFLVQDGHGSVGFSVPNSPDRTFYGGLQHDYQVFFHALDAAGNRIAQRDASFYPGQFWCTGDRILMNVDLDLTDAATLRVGFYRILDAETSEIEAVDVLDIAGNPAGNWFDIPLGGS
ncbi:MAG: hypothetical protein IPM16_08875 [Chloroflexi bacterium]|nr:hypothetical protein [Chloroflexota bacterium]